MGFAENLKKLLDERGINAKVVGTAVNIPRSTISEWMNGREPTFNDSLIRLAKFFGVSVEYLLTGAEPEEKIVKDVVGELETHFTKIHSGVYRVSIEKLRRE